MKFESNFIHFHSRKCISKGRLRNDGHFVSVSMCSNVSDDFTEWPLMLGHGWLISDFVSIVWCKKMWLYILLLIKHICFALINRFIQQKSQQCNFFFCRYIIRPIEGWNLVMRIYIDELGHNWFRQRLVSAKPLPGLLITYFPIDHLQQTVKV